MTKEDVINSLPSHLRDRLMRGWLGVEVEKSEVIKELDRILGIGKKRDFVKTHRLEIDRNYLADYSHFFIAPRILEENEDVFFDVSPPTCDVHIEATGSGMVCPWGSRITSPIAIRPESLKGLGIAEISRVWDFRTKELVLSTEVKKLFEYENVTGLDFQECWTKDGGENKQVGEPPAYVARIVNGTYQCGDDIIPGRDYCEKHSIVLTPYIFGERTPREALSEHDFQRLSSVRVGNKEYYHYKSLWVVTRRVLELLLKHRVRGLRPATVILDEPFRPLIVS
jgi:hypothetical protein